MAVSENHVYGIRSVVFFCLYNVYIYKSLNWGVALFSNNPI